MDSSAIRQPSAEEKQAECEYEEWLRECTEPVTEDFCRERYLLMWPRMLAYFACHKPANGKEPEDAAAEVFLHFSKHGKLKKQWSKQSLYWRAGKNLRSYARKAQREAYQTEPLDEENPSHQEATAVFEQAHPNSQELGDWLEEKCGAPLSPEQRKAVLLDGLEEFNTDQLAEALGKGRSQAHAFLSKTKKKLVAGHKLKKREELEIKLFGRAFTQKERDTVDTGLQLAALAFNFLLFLLLPSHK